MRRDLAIHLFRVVVGLVFLLEGILIFLRPVEYGATHFLAIGLPNPDLLAPFVGLVEVLAGLAVIFDFYAGDAAVTLLCILLTALYTTKLPILLGHPLGPFHPQDLPRYGLLTFLHEARAEFLLLFGLVAILIDSGVRIGRRRRWYQSP